MRRPLRWHRARSGCRAPSRCRPTPPPATTPPPSKIAAPQGYGASVRLYDRYPQAREQTSRALAERAGLTLIPPYDHADVLAGQGTAAKELFEEVGPLDAFFVCLGG